MQAIQFHKILSILPGVLLALSAGLAQAQEIKTCQQRALERGLVKQENCKNVTAGGGSGPVCTGDEKFMRFFTACTPILAEEWTCISKPTADAKQACFADAKRKYDNLPS